MVCECATPFTKTLNECSNVKWTTLNITVLTFFENDKPFYAIVKLYSYESNKIGRDVVVW